MPLPLWGFDEYNNFEQLKDSRAVFLNATFDMTPTVTLRAGVRYTKDKITISNFYALEGGLANPGPVGYAPDGGVTWWTQTIGAQPGDPQLLPDRHWRRRAPRCPPSADDNDNVSGKVGIDWKPSEDLLTYFSVSQGYRGAAFNGQAFNDPSELNFAGSGEAHLVRARAQDASCGTAAAPSTPPSSTTTTTTSSSSTPSRCPADWAPGSTRSTRRSRASMARNSSSAPRRRRTWRCWRTSA